MHRHTPTAALLVLGLVLTGCSGSGDVQPGSPHRSSRPATSTSTTASATASTTALPRLAADGSIYFVASVGKAVPRKPRALYLSRRGEAVRRVIATPAGERCPRVSPDGRHLAYLDARSRHLVVVLLDADGTHGAPLARAKLQGSVSSCPQWSPDGDSLGYAVVLGSQNTPLYQTRPAEARAVRLDGRQRVLASFAVQIWHEPSFARLTAYQVGWSGDGRQLLAMADERRHGYALVSVPLDGTPSETRTPWTWADDWMDFTDVDWSSR